MNYSVVPFQNYSTYPGIGNEKFRPYAPIAAPITDFFLGGTGLSGLALFESRSGSFPSSWDSVMFVANPITGTIHAVKIGETEGGGYSTTRLANFLTSSDEQFRPIALQFGPDGCLYIVDWYNKIISHNEVSREHPARDKSRGRVWRVRHESQTRRDIPDLTKVPDLALVEYLKSDSTWEMRAAWRQIMFRQPRHLAPALAQLAQDESQRADARIHALWSLKSLGEVNAKISLDMLRSPNRNIRREALRVQDGWLESSMVDDPDPQVRAEAIRSLLRQENFTQDHMFELIRFAKPSLGVAPVADIPWAGRHGTPVPAGPLYDREFERFLVRMGLERQPASLVQFLESRRAGQLDPESRLFASLALPSDQVVGHFLRAWQDVDRLPNEEELVLLLRGRSDRKLMPLMEELFSDPKRSPGLMRAALGLRDRLEQSGLEDVFTPALLRLSRSQGQEDLLVDMVAAFQLKKLRKPVAKVLANSRHDLSLRIAALQALRRIGAGADQAVLACLDPSTTPQGLRLSALVAVGASGSAQHFSRVIKAITKLSQVELEGVVDELSRTVAGANLLLSGILEAQIPESLLASNAWERMSELLPNNREMQEIWAQKAKSLPQALQLDGSPGQYSATQLSLSGPFTVEAWVRLEEGIDNADGLLGRPGGADLNFHDARARFYGGPALGDLVIAKRRMTPEIWTHVALSRDRSGIFRIYLDGELDAVGKNKNTSDFQYLDIGRTSPTQAGTAGALMEFRLWSHARSADAIRTFFRHKLSVREEGLVLSFPWGGDPRSLEGGAHVVPISQSPRLLDEVAAAKQEQELARYRGMIEKPGDVNRGASLFQGLCLSCHTVGGKGAGVAPALDGTSHRDLDSLLRAVVFPNAAFEPGYRTYRLETYSGEIYEGFFVGKDELGTTIGFMGGTQVFVEAKDIRRARFLDRSFMLAGILDGLDDQRVADLFAMIATIP